MGRNSGEIFGFGSPLRGTSNQLYEYRNGEPFLGGDSPYLRERSSALFDMLVGRVTNWEEVQAAGLSESGAPPDPGIPPQEFAILATNLITDCFIGHDGYGTPVPDVLSGQPPFVYPQLSMELKLWVKAAFGDEYIAEMNAFSDAISSVQPG